MHKEARGTDRLCVLLNTHRGFNYILQEEANRFLKPNDSRLLLDTMVTRVRYDGPHGVVVHTANGDRIFADYAICTFSWVCVCERKGRIESQ